MKIKISKLITLLLVGFIVISLLGGSAIWFIFGFSDNLTIDGEATNYSSPLTNIGDDWTSYGGDTGGNRYSKLDQINSDNIQQLEIAWTHKTGAFEGRESVKHRTAFQATPILVDDSLIFCTPFNEVIAVHPDTGKLKWKFDPKINIDTRPANDFTCRGVAYWQSQNESETICSSRIFVGTSDSRLISLDAKTGLVCEGFGESGEVQIEPNISLRWPGEFQITSAPVIFGDIIITGSSIGDNLRSEAPSGTVHAFNVESGELVWSFNPIPQNPNDPARKSWANDSADKVGHANVWSTMSVDEDRGLVFLPTSSASPDYYGGGRIGDNNYANSVVALEAQTGKVAWHFQTVHHDVWDYDLPSQPGLYQVWKDGKLHDVVAQATKTGFIFVLDRDTGEAFLPIEERAVPQGGVDGEVLSETQPFPVITPAIVPDKVSPDDAFGITLWDKLACKETLSNLRSEGLFTPPSTQGTLQYPFSGGGANWGSTAYDPTRNLLVVNMSSAAHAITLYPNIEDREKITELNHNTEFAPMEGVPYSMSRELVFSPLSLPCVPPPWGVIAGVDLATGEIVWRKVFGTTEDLAKGLALKLGTPNFGGPIITGGGLIFIGAAMDNYLRAFNVTTGDELWKGRLPAGGQATPMTYEWNDKQYVVIAAGGHGKSTTTVGDYLVAFALPN